MSIHIVRQGEVLSRIARRYGVQNVERIYNHPKNAEFKKKRPNPNLIFPGDEIFIPEPGPPKQVACATDASHTFKVKVRKRRLHIVLRDTNSSVMRDEPFQLDLQGVILDGRTDGDGLIDVAIPDDAVSGTLDARSHRYHLAIGDLNPIDHTPDEGISGAQGRLANLGYDVGPIDG